ncbi:hypothetical protein RclHR1_03420011 [Rhizophagus clarus]|uniref:Protein argonaute N-terminal domain-containing protein n=1 Tax=Rhizophagus clarus TaxID=94130 RepID=A0A2Z6S4W2_9GLOM|nr:hypothetical protein RclHR1_03420011 [Rhizophagus clarus]
MGEPAFEIIKSPGIGDVGRKIKVRTNFFKVNSMQEANISHYDVNIIPVVPPRANKDVQLNMEIFNRFVEQNQQALGNTRPVFDGMYSTTKRLFFITNTQTILN